MWVRWDGMGCLVKKFFSWGFVVFFFFLGGVGLSSFFFGGGLAMGQKENPWGPQGLVYFSFYQ